MDLQLSGKAAVVTGGSKGIGLAVVRELLAAGARVVAGSRTVTPELARTDAIPVAVDLATPDGPGALIERAVAELGGLDVLVNNVGGAADDGSIRGAVLDVAHLPDDAWQHALEVNFFSMLRATRAALPHLVERGGTVISVSSAGARAVTAGPVDYNVAKAALNALTKVVAEQFGPHGVRALTVSPGPVSTGVWTDPHGFIGQVAAHLDQPHEEFAQRLMAGLAPATGRMSTPEEVARLVVFLASPLNLTGADVRIDGGVVKTA